MSTIEELNVIGAEYIASAVRTDQYPEGDLPEVAFLGRSNVGKSSLINSLCRRRGLARVSNTPGKTQTLNYYRVTTKRSDGSRFEFFLVDLPGYGYAKRGQASRIAWSKFINEYLVKSNRLRLVFQLIDIRHSPMASDITAYQWLTDADLPVRLIATKADKLSRMAVNRQLQQIKKEIGAKNTSVLAYSSETGAGRSEVLAMIEAATASIGGPDNAG